MPKKPRPVCPQCGSGKINSGLHGLFCLDCYCEFEGG